MQYRTLGPPKSVRNKSQTCGEENGGDGFQVLDITIAVASTTAQVP
jgi:hypothetical protein